MLRKRLIGVVTVKDGWAVQSFGYRRWLPLGRPEVLVANLDRWGADEIMVQCIDRTARGLGPDWALLERIGKLGLSTPMIYSGGLATADDATRAVKLAADRVAFDAAVRRAPEEIDKAGQALGAQAVVVTLPLSRASGELRWLDHVSGAEMPLGTLADDLAKLAISEALVVDWHGEGNPGAFDLGLLDAPLGLPLIAFGGISDGATVKAVLDHPQTVAAAVGNFLSYREHAIQHLRRESAAVSLRPAQYRAPAWEEAQ
jgi:imidazole glycerol-phosphate synthase subunit HisF